MTQYNWPTWADIIGTKWKYFENWGKEGAGNHFIFNSVIECDIKHNLTSNDTVVIMWTAPARYDQYIVNKWGHAHHIFNTDNNMAPCPDGYWLISFSYMYAINQLLKNRKIPHVMGSWVDFSKGDSKFHEMYKNLLTEIQYFPISMKSNIVPKITDIDTVMKFLYDALSGPDWPSLEDIKKNQYSTTPAIQVEIDNFWKDLKNDKRVAITSMVSDQHPLPSEHLNIAKAIFPTLNLDDSLQQVCMLDTKLKNGESINFDKKLARRMYE